MSNGNNIDLSILQNPLTPTDIANLKDTLVQIGLTRNALREAELAGLDMKAQLAQLDQSEEQTKKLLEVYDKS